MINNTATEAGIKKNEKDMQERGIECAMLSFQQRWSPKDRQEAHEFQTQLFMLVRRIYVDAQQPGYEQITKMVMSMPMPPIFVSGKPRP